ncbi:hypothetical protein GWI33_008581 [Rhynchophorus ferrugineus]|uniref:Uncharacterized protein n=1 Tax=Rhynchophorus ferrugineus TaxID=354439 RepID=A0A834IEF8_RHYFE|nr:hypothetical protein GWI33_008581 [Rhynchophorus ferrugineus]
MRLSVILVFVLLIVSLTFQSVNARPSWLKKRLKSLEKAVRRVRDRARENLPLVSDYVGVAAQAGLIKGG